MGRACQELWSELRDILLILVVQDTATKCFLLSKA
jgi:hypothetical protein